MFTIVLRKQVGHYSESPELQHEAATAKDEWFAYTSFYVNVRTPNDSHFERTFMVEQNPARRRAVHLAYSDDVNGPFRRLFLSSTSGLSLGLARGHGVPGACRSLLLR